MSKHFYLDELKKMTWSDIKRQLPMLRENVFHSVRDLTPNRLVFELAQSKERKFNTEGMDRETRELIMLIMSKLMDEPKLVFTGEELTLCFHRFNELIMLHECCRQGILKETANKKGEVLYEILNMEPPSSTETITEFKAQPPQYHATIRIYS